LAISNEALEKKMNAQRLSRNGVGETPEMVSMYYFYTLNCPVTNEVKYVGRTVNLKNRFRNHIYESKKNNRNKKEKWIVSLLRKNKLPIMKVIWQGNTTLSIAIKTEETLIKRYSKKFKLKNGTDRGLGGSVVTKMIYQFSINGDFLNSYPNANQAMLQTGVKDVNITRCCKNENGYGSKQAGNFFWSYLPYKTYPHKYLENWRQLKGKPVIVVNKITNEVVEYISGREASKATGVNFKHISAICNKKRKENKLYDFKFK
jgi:predicted GIY-YIG superfamily endonuclease